ncbi:M20/M25/M40 family metallo-hydrolase [Acidisoma cellulosilytica]|uniref:M20/M25/M40 family metallo-hydrolase n=1 Tax=Acidisoma cellulosilyticum TaxID=2802395 RepID=A0A963Z1Q5_9PROT|nr:M20/M25/M40 family metallo-hydrolase [Acidisoma cellulosilyticum]MCB8881242.1 M20/M25/M40 family metallo-hydrolase [Acidisoma cellulosilyticum]
MMTLSAAPALNTDDATARLLSRLVEIPSINPAFRAEGDPPSWFGEKAKAEFVAGWLREAGIAVAFQAVLPDRPNVIARVPGRKGQHSLLLECHLDTVQVAGMDAPFTPVVTDGLLHGRGAVDDGGCVAAMMLAMQALAANPADCDVILLAAMDEEYQYRGISAYLAAGNRADGGIAGEPTSLRVVTACKGCVRWRIEVVGRAAHSSEPWRGLDAIAAATDLLAHLRAELAPRLAARSHPLVGSPTLVCSMIEGGQGPNTIAERCLLTFDRRTLPGESGLDSWMQARQAAEAFAERLPDGIQMIVHPPFIDSLSMAIENADDPIIQAARAVCRAEGLDDTPVGVAYGSDATKMTDVGVPTIVFGPGSIAQAHAVDEFVAIADVTRAARMIEDIARTFKRS